MRQKTLRKRLLNGDGGASLAMVLIFIVIIGLSMASLAVLVQASNASLSTNKYESFRRAQIINSALPQAIASMTTSTRRVGVDPNENCDYITNPPSGATPVPLPIQIKVLNKDSSVTNEAVTATWAAACKSGQTQPVASFVLTGSNANSFRNCGPQSITLCTVGVDGGLSLDSNPTFPVKISGGIINASGAWKNVDNTSLALTKVCTNASITDVTQCQSDPIPQIIIPSDGPDNFCSLYATSSACICPTNVVYMPTNFTADNESICPRGATAKTFEQIDPISLTSDIGAYIDSISAGLTDVSTLNLADIPISCSAADTTITTISSGSESISVVQISPGYVGFNEFIKLKDLLKSSSCGKGTPASPAIQFLGGVYRFNWCENSDFNSTNNYCLLDIDQTNLRVFGGTPVYQNSQWDCNSGSTLDALNNGVQFQFENYSYMKVSRGNVFLCPYKKVGNPVIAAPVYKVSRGSPLTTTKVSPFEWKGGQIDYLNNPIFINLQGNASPTNLGVKVYFHGQVFVPDGWLDLKFNGDTIVSFGKGVVARAITISGTGSAQNSSSVAPPGSYNGDRVIQFHFKAGSQDLGIVQVAIKDYFGRRWGAGFKIIAWRTLW